VQPIVSGFTMFLTAVVWGLGVSVGGSIGTMCFVLMLAAFKRATESETAKEILSFHERSHEALQERNQLTEKQIEHIAAIRWAMETLAAKESR
jgi:hypothetical protein